VKVAVDDFGTGHSNVRLLLECRPDVVKLTREIVAGVDTDEYRRRLLTDLARVAEGLSARVIAEGIERPEELAVVRAAGIESAQGYLLGRPMPAVALLAQLRR
jgi:EAL domain-containing protein (putative c-di-GMP-specific phosphodiesterase class I)